MRWDVSEGLLNDGILGALTVVKSKAVYLSRKIWPPESTQGEGGVSELVIHDVHLHTAC